MINWLVNRIIAFAQRTPYRHIGDYMHRYWILRERSWFPFAIRVHHIRRSDAGRDLHDHPFWYATLILRGGYFEITEDQYDGRQKNWKGAGTISFHTTRFRHRLVNKRGTSAWTLFIHGRHKRKWGFWDHNDMFIRHDDYSKSA